MGRLVSCLLGLSFALLTKAALPPGYEDDAWCPAGWCLKDVDVPEGFVGPSSAYVECYNPTNGETCEEVWTGEATNTVAPEGWIIASECESTDLSASC